MPKRTPLLKSSLTATERYHVKDSLGFGPWRLVTVDGLEPGGPRRFSDAELEAHWHGWASEEKAPGGRRDWDETDWGYRRFVLGEDERTAFRECRRLQYEQDERDEAEYEAARERDEREWGRA